MVVGWDPAPAPPPFMAPTTCPITPWIMFITPWSASLVTAAPGSPPIMARITMSRGTLAALLPGAERTVRVVWRRVMWTGPARCWPPGPAAGRWRELQGRKGSKLLRLPTLMPGGGGGPSGRLMVGPTATCTCGPAPPPCCCGP